MECIFCNIINELMPADIIFKNDKVVVFKDINPKAPVHILVVPHLHVPSVNDLKDEHKDMIADMIFAAIKAAKDLKVDSGYKLSFNVGRKGGQLVDHIHLHLMAGWEEGASN